MRALLDTHAFLWFCSTPERLGARAHSFIVDGDNDVLLSVVTAWEIAIKYARGHMPELPAAPESYIPDRISHYSFEPLAISMSHAFRVAQLPAIHRDPFDRMLIAQAQAEDLPIITSDAHMARYDVQTIW